jgi:hypothetical protein
MMISSNLEEDRLERAVVTLRNFFEVLIGQIGSNKMITYKRKRGYPGQKPHCHGVVVFSESSS